jgi:DNA-directed RNA polymerase specialized sigma24 family protein
MTTVIQSLESHKQQFANCILPIVERYARIVFRFLRHRPDDMAEAVSDCVAHAWEGYAFALRAGKEPWHFPTMLAVFAARKTKVGRKVGKEMNCKDVFNAARAQRAQLEYCADEPDWQEVLTYNTETPVHEQAAFRIDFPAWLETLPSRNRVIAEALADGNTAQDVARRLQVSPGRMTQLRQELRDDWNWFTA